MGSEMCIRDRPRIRNIERAVPGAPTLTVREETNYDGKPLYRLADGGDAVYLFPAELQPLALALAALAEQEESCER